MNLLNFSDNYLIKKQVDLEDSLTSVPISTKSRTYAPTAYSTSTSSASSSSTSASPSASPSASQKSMRVHFYDANKELEKKRQSKEKAFLKKHNFQNDKINSTWEEIDAEKSKRKRKKKIEGKKEGISELTKLIKYVRMFVDVLNVSWH